MRRGYWAWSLLLLVLVPLLSSSHPTGLSYLGEGGDEEKEANGTEVSLERIFTFFTDNTKNSIRFYLFTNNRNGSEEIVLDNPGSLRKSHFDSRNQIKILIHGYKRNGFSDFPHIVKDAYLNVERERRSGHGSGEVDLNVICVDWRRQAKEPIYLNSAYNTRMVGERVGEFIVFLKDSAFISAFSQVHLVGFSLGAQVAGYAGKYVQSTRRAKVGRITGLDPAGPAFTGPDAKNRLDSSDAQFVDVIHTSIWKSGLAKSIGHTDFFPNSGEYQPGCSFEHVVDPFLGGCSHTRAVELFTESVRKVELFGCKCGSWTAYARGLCDCRKRKNLALMGEYCAPSTRGNYFLKTDGAPPFRLSAQEAHPVYNATAAFQIFISTVIARELRKGGGEEKSNRSTNGSKELRKNRLHSTLTS